MFNSTYHVFKDYDVLFDEKASTCGTIRKVQWVREGAEPDESKAKVEIRHIKVDETGETPLKGYSFSTPEGPDELTEGMIKAGFGKTKEILKAVRMREDFLEAANTINDDEDEGGDGETFDMRDLLLGAEESDVDDEDEGDE